MASLCAGLWSFPVLNAAAQVSTFANANRITINDAAPATPYPSVIWIDSNPNLVSRVTVTLSNLQHAFPRDLDILLVGPAGHSVVLMSDTGGRQPATNVVLTFDDAAAVAVPDVGPIPSGVYRPTNLNPPGEEDFFYPPAPAGPYGATLADFMGTSPSGEWKLFIVDDAGSDDGVVLGGWQLDLTLADPATVADLAVGIDDWRDPILSDEKLVYTISVTNLGPYGATDVLLADVLPPEASFLFAKPSQGSCGYTNSQIVCSLGDLPAAAVATVFLGAAPARSGVVTNGATVTASSADFWPRNSTAAETTTIKSADAADLVVTATGTPDPVVLGQSLTYTVVVTNDGPLDATGVVLTNSLPSSVSLLSVETAQGSCSVAGNLVICAFGNLSNQASASVSIIVRPNGMGYITNEAAAVANEFDITPENATASTGTLVYIPTDLSVAQTDSSDPASLGSNLTYTVSIFNNGPGIATGVMLSNVLPVDATFVAATTGEGSCQLNPGGWVQCAFGSMAPRTRAQVAITVRLGMMGKFYNIASVSANETDPNPSNNTSTESTTIFPGGDGIVITPSTNAVELANAITAAGSTGIRVTRAALQAQVGSNYVFGQTNIIVVPAYSSGLYSVINPPFTYDLHGLGVVLSTGNVLDYQTGPSSSPGNTAGFFVQATTNQQALLVPITTSGGRTFTHYDVTELDVEFDLLPGFDSVLFNVVFGSEEYPEFVNSSYIDGFGIYLNGVNIAYTGGKPVNINHPDMRAMQGTELDGILAPGGNPIVSFSAFLGSGATNNRLTFIIADTSDSVLDTTVYVSSLQGVLPPNADLAVALTGPTNHVTVGSNLTYRIAITNQGPDIATGTILSNRLPAGVSFISAVPSQGSCVFVDGVVICDLFALDKGYSASVTITAVPTLDGFLTNVTTVSSSLKDFYPTNNAATDVTLAVAYGSFVSTDAILVNDAAPAAPYPATIAVSGVNGVITQTVVKLKGLSHSFPDDLNLLLVGPSGQSVLLMADAGANQPMQNVTLTFSDRATVALPEAGPITSGLYRPTSYDPVHALWPPAPPRPYGATLSVFNGTSPQGTWSLYAYDDTGLDAGMILGGWSLTFGLDPQAVPAVSLSVRRVGNQVVLAWPATAQGFVLESAGALLSSPVWSIVTNSTALVGDQRTVALDISGSAAFYRLKKTVP